MADLIPQVPVKITDNTNTVVVTGANALKVDGSAVTQPVSGTVTANQGTAAAGSGAWPITITNTSDTVVKPGDSVNNAIRVNVVAGSVGGASITDDSAFTVGSTNIAPVGGIYQATPDAVNDGDAGAFRMTQTRAQMVSVETPAGDSAMDDTNDAVRVNVVAGSTGGVSHVDEAAFTEGSSAMVPIGGVFNDAGSTPPSEDTAAAARITSSRGLHVNLRNASGTEIGTAGNPVRVDPTGSTTQPVSGTVTANAGTGTFTVAGTVTANAGTGTFTVAGTVTANAGTGTFLTRLTDGTNNMTTLFDVDSGGGNQYVQGVSLRKAASGGSVELGTSSDPVRVDPTGTTTQPISGTVTANAGSGTFTVSGTVTSNQGTAAAGSGAWPVTVTDTSNTVVKPGDATNNAVRVNLVASAFETTTGLVHSASSQSAIATGNTGTITYTTSGSGSFYLKQIIAAASAGPCKVTVDYGAGPTVVAIVFFSSANPYVSIVFDQPVNISSSTAVNVKIRNDAGASQDVYATIIGRQV